MLKHLREQPGALQRHRVAVGIQAGDLGPLGPAAGNDSPGTDRQPSSSSSGSGIVFGTGEVSSTGLITTPRW